MIKKSIASLVVILALIGAAFGVYQLTGQDESGADGKIAVATSYYPLYDFAKQVGGDKVSVTNMTPAGSEPHDYEPSPQDLIRAYESAVFIYNGASLEPWVTSFLPDYKHISVKASNGIALHEAGDDHEHKEADHDDSHSESATDPHFWLDPVLAQQIVITIRDGLSAADPDNSDYYKVNADRYNQKLAELDQKFADGTKSCTIDTAVSAHSAFSYLADRYGFSVASISGIEPDDEPTPAKMAELTDLVRQKGIQYVFFESLVSPRLAETIANEAGASVLLFDPLEGLSQEDQDKGRDYISVQYDNLANLKKALNCS